MPSLRSSGALAMLAKCGPIRSGDLAKELFLDQSTVSRHIAHLEASGLVEKVADPDDRRATQLHLTDLGHKYVQDFWRQHSLTEKGEAFGYFWFLPRWHGYTVCCAVGFG